jgi:antitoxin component of MazEF toxin-antitoxin module
MKTVALRQIGNSQGIILEKTILELVHADEKNAVFDVQVEGNKIVLRPLSRAEQKAMIMKAAQEVTDEQAPVLKKLAK